MKFFRVLCVMAIALCLTASVYAETQSVKVSGDLTVRSIFRNQYDYVGSIDESNGTGATNNRGPMDSAHQSWAMSVAAVRIDADLTDNVTTVIRILNQRDWNVYSKTINSTTSMVPNGRGLYGANTDEFDVMLDLAYVTLKDFIYQPLTLTIGRQDLWLGKGFIVGLNQQNPGTGAATGPFNLIVPGNLSAPEYTQLNAFDSVKAVLDYDPWTITAIYALVYTNAIQANDDVSLWGINVGYKFNAYKGEAEGYWFYKADRSLPSFNGDKRNSNDVWTVGLRGSFDPINVITLAGEGAYQGGEFMGNMNQIESIQRSAYAFDFSGECRYLTDKFAWKPILGTEYVLYSGNKPIESPSRPSGTYNGWDPMYRGKFDSAIREFVGRYYQTRAYPARATFVPSSPDASFTNQSQVIFSGSVQPMDSLKLKANYNLFWNIEKYDHLIDKSKGFVGQEVDLQAIWDYTEDVSFGLLYGVFLPGEVYYQDKNAVATDLVGTVKVSF